MCHKNHPNFPDFPGSKWGEVLWTYFAGDLFGYPKLGGGFKHFLFSPLFGEDYRLKFFQMG